MSIIVTNTNGSFALFGIKSRYQGVFLRYKNETYRTIAHIELGKELYAVRNELWRAIRERDGIEEAFWFAPKQQVFFYELSSPAKADIFFDCKKNYDNSEWERIYDFKLEKETLLVHFEKKNNNITEYCFWLALHGCEFEIINKWEEVNYNYDEERQSKPYRRWVLKGCRIDNSFVMAFSESKEEALRIARTAWKNRKKTAERARNKTAKCPYNKYKDDEINNANKCAEYSLSSLQENNGLLAGLPWFTQHWARDEIISTKALMLTGKKKLAKTILLKWLEKLENGKLPGAMNCKMADSGWLFLRFEHCLAQLTKQEKEKVRKKLEQFLKEIKLENGLVANKNCETWMDSIDRKGNRIEIQALVLAGCRLMRKLGKKTELEEKLSAKTRNELWKDGWLLDGMGDETARANAFIAAYAYPELLTTEEWKKCFDNLLSKLWLEWGGLSTIDISSPDFANQHTGENPKSYHSGDSWFWLNNLAAIVLCRSDKKKYGKYVERILNASTQEILREGAIGHHSELSSAQELKPAGSLSQAFSAAMYVELVNEFFCQ